MISRYRMALMQVVDLCCILLALAVSGMVTIAPDLSVFDDYTGASLFTIFFYLLFFYYQAFSFFSPRGLIGTACELLSAAVFAGFGSWGLYRALAKSGVLARFSSGQ